MRRLHEEIQPALSVNQTRTLRGPHITALIEDFFRSRRRTHEPAASTFSQRRAA
jgi:hypothetical protein